jgi:drug/metabolite transporter (DMT)-like permease
MKLIYQDDQTMDPSTLTAIRTVLSALALGIAVAVEQSNTKKGGKQEEGEAPVVLTSTTEDRAEGILTWTSSSVMIAGIELGIYNFLGTSLQAQGIQLTSATRAGFLSQLAAVLTPALSVFIGEKISLKVWFAIALGLLGSSLVALDSIDGSQALSELSIEDSEELKGAAFLLSACLFYSLATVRLGLVAQKFSSVNLAAWKKLTLGLTSIGWFLVTPHEGNGFNDWLDHRSFISILLILYSSLGSGALGTFLQTRGQRSVSATRAQVLYGLVPIWSAVAAFFVFGSSEGSGVGTWVGGSLVLVAGILASQKREGS